MLTRRQCGQMLADIARAEIGQREESSNRGPSIETYQRATTLAPEPWPWCAAFVAWCLQAWAKSPLVTEAFGIKDADAWRFKSARAYDLETWARSRGFKPLSGQDELLPGDLLTYEFSHCGIVTLASTPISGYVLTVEGNTNADGTRDGDGVYEKRRNRTLVRSAIRLG